MKAPFELEALAKGADGSLDTFILRISSPKFEEGRGYFCTIEYPFIREKDMKVFGIDGEQAAELAFDLVRSLLEHKAAILVDRNGNPLDIPWT